jgi:hypothetical protein
MSILIIALPRTGSTALLHKIADENNFKSLFEPFDGTNRVKYKGEKDVVVKTIICHHSNNLELAKDFDNVILLSRKNLLECAESHAYQTYFSKVKNYNSNHPYYYEEVPKEIFEVCYNDIIEWDNDIKKLALDLNLSITYYEDLYNPLHKDRLRKGKRTDLKMKLF